MGANKSTNLCNKLPFENIPACFKGVPARRMPTPPPKRSVQRCSDNLEDRILTLCILVEWYVVLLFVIEVTYAKNRLHQCLVPLGFVQILQKIHRKAYESSHVLFSQSDVQQVDVLGGGHRPKPPGDKHSAWSRRDSNERLEESSCRFALHWRENQEFPEAACCSS
jgi:hypothetical protein